MDHNRTALLTLHYFPNIQFFSKLSCYPRVLIEQQENYLKRSYRNRCHLASPKGILRMSVPLEKGKNQQMPIRQVRISFAQAWNLNHWRSIQSLYGKAPFFSEYGPVFEGILSNPPDRLFDLNLQILNTLLECLNLSPQIDLTDEYYTELPEEIVDYREIIRPQPASATPKDPYFHPYPYAQIFQEITGFLPNLSILDLLFCMGPEAKLILKRCCLNSG
jgi:hypothetical protein